MWLRVSAGQHAAADAVHPPSAPGHAQVKVVASRSCSAGLGSSRRVQRGCVSTVVGRCQQGCEASSAAQPPNHDEQQLPASSSMQDTVLHHHSRQVPQMLHLQQAPALTAALDLQHHLQHVQQQLPHPPQQQPAGRGGPLQWLTSGHGSSNGSNGAQQPDQAQQHNHQLQLQHNQPQHSSFSAGEQELPQQKPLQQQQHHQQQEGVAQPHAASGQQQQQPQQPEPEQPEQPGLQQQPPVQPAQDKQWIMQPPQPLPPPQLAHPQQQPLLKPGQPQVQPQAPQQGQQLQGQQLRVHITAQIIQQDTLPALQHLYQQHSGSCNAINLSALLVRLAHIQSGHAAPAAAATSTGSTTSGPGSDNSAVVAAGSGGVQQFAVQVMQDLVAQLGQCGSARQAANACWALALLQCQVPPACLQSAAQQLVAQQGRLLAASRPQEVANLAWGLAKLQLDPAASLWPALAAVAQDKLGRFKPCELAMLAWALADTQQRLQRLREQQLQQQQRERLQQLQWRRQQQAWQQRQQQQQALVEGCDASSPAQPSSSDHTAAQHAARRQSHAEASTSAAASGRGAWGSVSLDSIARYSGSSGTSSWGSSPSSSSSGSSRGGMARRLTQPMRPAARARPFLREGSQSQQQQQQQQGRSSSPNRSSSRGAGAAAAGSDSSRGSRSSGAAAAVHSQPECAFEQQLQQLLPGFADAVVQKLKRGQQQFKAKEAAMLLWACGVLGFKHEGLLGALALFQQQQLQQGTSNSQDVANSVWALGKLRVSQPLLLAAAAEQPQLLQHSSCQELGLVLYGSAAAMRQQRLQQADSAELLPAVALWQAAAAQALSGGTLQLGLGAAEAATLLQAASLLLEPLHQRRARRARQQPVQQQQQQQQRDAGDSGAQGSSAVNSSLGTWSFSSMATTTCSLDSLDEAAAVAVAVAPTQARQLIAAVDAGLCRQAAAGRLPLPLSAQHVAAMLHSLAVAGVAPSPGLKQLLLSAAVAAAPAMDRQELAMTAWAAAKLFGGSGSSNSSSSEGVQQLMEAVDRAAGPLLQAMSPLQLSQLAWAHGRLWQLGDSLFMAQLAQAAGAQLAHFGPQALANTTWAFAQLRHYDAALTSAVGRRARALLGQFTPAELSNLTWALVTLRHRHSGLLRAVAGHAAGACSSWDAKACVKLATAYCSRGMPTHRYRSLLGALADSLADKPARAWTRLTPHELAQLLAALAVGRVRHRACTAQAVAAALARLPRLALHDLVSIVWALAMLGHPADALLQAVSTRVVAELQGGDCQQQLEQQVLQQQQQQQPHGWGVVAGGHAGSLQAAEQQEQQLGLGAVPQPGDAASQQGSSSAAAPSSGPLAGVPIHAVLGSRLKAPYLARLAWAYKTFGHADAEWYLAAGQLLAMEDTSSSSSSSSISSSLISSMSGNGSSAGQDGAGVHAGDSSTAAADGCNRRHQGPSGATAAAAWGASRPGSSGLQRPAFRPVQLPSAAPGDSR